jgi:hypothetical protein
MKYKLTIQVDSNDKAEAFKEILSICRNYSGLYDSDVLEEWFYSQNE